MTLEELVEKYEEETLVHIEDSRSNFEVVFDGSIEQLKKSSIFSGFLTSRAWHTIYDWYVDVSGKLQITF